MEIEITKAGRLILDVPQQIWHAESNNITQIARFSAQEMMAIQKSDEEPDNYELKFLGLKVSGFDSMESAKEHAPKFAKSVFETLSSMVSE